MLIQWWSTMGQRGKCCKATRRSSYVKDPLTMSAIEGIPMQVRCSVAKIKVPDTAQAGHAVAYRPVEGPLRVWRFTLREPFGKPLNVIKHPS
jgi:hypothetical protein